MNNKTFKFSAILILIFAIILTLGYFFLIPAEPQGELKRELGVGVVGIFQNKVQEMLISPPLNKYSLNTKWNLDAKNPMSVTKTKSNNFQIEINPKYFVGTRSDTGKNDITIDFVKIVLSHEALHILTLQDSELKSNFDPQLLDKNTYLQLEAICLPNYFNKYGCSKIDSLINKFYTKFWIGEMKNGYDLIQNTSKGSDNDFKKQLTDWGEKYKDSFITTRSIENPEEDLAEILSFWITDINQNKTLSSTVKEKIAFVESQPELVQFKKEFNESFDKIFEPTTSPKKS